MVPGYYEQLGLLSPGEVDIHDEETNINLLFALGLRRIAFLPFGYLTDRFRWDLYAGKASKVRVQYSRTVRIFNTIDQDNMNCHWWKLRSKIQGIAPPSQRNNLQFDAGAKSHVARNTNYVRYLLTAECTACFQKYNKFLWGKK